MKGAILEKGEDYFTYMKSVFNGIKHAQKNYNWLITDLQDGMPSEFETCELYDFGMGAYTWITGEKLTELVEKDDFQWVWAVLSGFPKCVSKNQVLQYEMPYADGYPGFWKNPISIQHPLAVTEIVAWDASSVLVISEGDKIVEDFLEFFPLAEDLELYNSR